MGSPLDLVNSEAFRKKLITRNLVPYVKSPRKITPPINYEVIQSDLAVVDSPDNLIDEPSFANKLFPLNQYGNDGGYKQVPDPGALLNTKSNEGEYGFQDANIVDQSFIQSQKWKPLNVFSNGAQVQLDSANFFNSLDKPQTTNNYNNQPYPTTFVPSIYSPVSILLSPDPSGSNGLLSSDSYIARLGAATLRHEFQERIGRQITKDTVGRANVFNVRSGTDVLNLITGRVPLIEPNYTITVDANPILAAANFALRLGGSILPVSTIPGSYWDTSINTKQPTTIQQLNNAFKRTATGKFFTRLLGSDKTGSQIFYNNTGGGQKSILFNNIDFNRYKPSYDRTLFDRLAGAIVGSTTNNSDFYIGSTTSDPSRVFSPGGDLPVNSYGQEQQSPVYGPQELAQLYEGPSKDVRLGANGVAYSNGGGIEGGFTWVSPKYKDNAGKTVGLGGAIITPDQDFKPSSYNSTESTNRTFTDGSILDDTQRLIDSQPQGGRRLQHVGNAIDQVSKVFNDGYNELTKGSRVLAYVGALGQEIGTEYCRVFAKDIPYLQYNDLQKTDGTTTEGRRFSYSVLDKTYNLNMYPNKQEGGQDSSNIIGSYNNAYAKKYMFSLENLAWSTSNSPGFAVSDLAVCERGPNGGRVMWFPPYGLTFSESVSANWKGNDFIGRPEPIYTYNNTNRTGSLTWKIVVDHPSVLNLIVNKVMNNETNKTRIDSILDSFFSGCKKYDLYELAKKYYTINPNDLFQLQQAITSKQLTKEQLQYSINTITTIPEVSVAPVTNTFGVYEQLGFYFENDYPKTFNSDFTSLVGTYLNQKSFYSQQSPSTSEQTGSFFNTVVDTNYNKLNNLITELATQLKNNEGTITITIAGTTSAPASKSYNLTLSDKRIDCAADFFTGSTILKKYVDLKRLIIINKRGSGEYADPMKYDEKTKTFFSNGKVNCADNESNSKTISKEIYTTNAMACRRAYIDSIVPKLVSPGGNENPAPVVTNEVVGKYVTTTSTVTQVDESYVQRDNITKRVLRSLLSECDYFETIKEETPMVYDNLKEKLKFFQPAFHSMTPEGLNTRLTFLQQCMRPGDTIPVIKTSNGTNVLQYNNATNTAFGTPPVLILRVGDFYNTKIIPTTLGLTYENLDINPEGIGIQPMIANVTMGFNFVGGSGLKESVDKLQNALSFNYYANSEMWDDRADSTENPEFLNVLDKEFFNKGIPPALPTVNQVQNNNGQSNGSFIGSVISSTVDSVDFTEQGTISYMEFMDKFLGETQNYFTNILNKNKECLKQYNNALRQQWTIERNYQNGNFAVNNDNTILFGKPYNVEQRIDKVFGEFVADIESNNSNTQDRYINFMDSQNFSKKVMRQLVQNYKNFVTNKRGTYQNAITKITQSIVDSEQNYIPYISRANILVFNGNPTTGTDGFQQKNGNVSPYDISGTTDVNASSVGATNTFEELSDDITKIQKSLIEYNDIISTGNTFNYKDKKYTGFLIYGDAALITDSKTIVKDVFIPFSDNSEFLYLSFRRSYMIVSEDITDSVKYGTFKNALIGNIITNKALLGNGNQNVETEFDNYWKIRVKPIFEEENAITSAFLDDMEKNKLKNFIKYTPFTAAKKRVFTYTTADNSNESSQQSLIKSLGATQNSNTDNTKWNTSSDGIVYFSKIKLN